MSSDPSPFPEERGSRRPPPRPPRTAVGALPPGRRPPSGRVRGFGSLRSIPLGPLVRRALWPSVVLAGLGGLLRFVSDTPVYRDFGVAMAITGLVCAALTAMLIGGIAWYCRR
jgi:hypothetical protein